MLMIENYLKNYVQAHPGRSMYGFSIDSEKPGYLKLCFLNKSTKDGGVVQTWVSPSHTSVPKEKLTISRSRYCPEHIGSTLPKSQESWNFVTHSKLNTPTSC
jgi:hypothetical protein